MSAAPRTVWRLDAVSGWGGNLDVTVAVDTTAPAIVDAIEHAAHEHGISLERVAGDDPRFGELVAENELAGLVVAFKALVARAGGHVELTEAELLAARALLARVDATPQVMTVELVEGAPPDGPRFAADLEREQAAEPRTPADRDELEHGLGDVDGAE